MIRASSDNPTHTTTLNEPEEDYDDSWGADVWGAGEEGNEADSKEDADTFFDATTSPSTTPPPAAVPYDDGGEPDFAGWLAAQSKAKAKKPLPKGLGKSASAREVPTRSSAAASRTSGSGAVRSSKHAAPAKVIDMKPKDEGEEDGWGDAW
jgi:SCY1-like protein 1